MIKIYNIFDEDDESNIDEFIDELDELIKEAEEEENIEEKYFINEEMSVKEMRRRVNKMLAQIEKEEQEAKASKSLK